MLTGMRPAVVTVVFLLACDYAPAERVEALSRKVDTVERRQTVTEARVEENTHETRLLQTGFDAMGDGFNVLADTVQEQDVRVADVENLGRRVQNDLQDVRKKLREARRPPQPRTDDILEGIRLDTLTLTEEPMRLRWCEAEEGVQGFLVRPGEEYRYTDVRCWRFGDVAVFRAQTTEGPEVSCLRSVEEVADGTLRALDCNEPGVIYRFSRLTR